MRPKFKLIGYLIRKNNPKLLQELKRGQTDPPSEVYINIYIYFLIAKEEVCVMDSQSGNKLWTTIFVWGKAIVIIHLNVGVCEAGEV